MQLNKHFEIFLVLHLVLGKHERSETFAAQSGVEFWENKYLVSLE